MFDYVIENMHSWSVDDFWQLPNFSETPLPEVQLVVKKMKKFKGLTDLV